MLIYLPVHLQLQAEQFSAFLTQAVSLLTVAIRATSVQNYLCDVKILLTLLDNGTLL